MVVSIILMDGSIPGIISRVCSGVVVIGSVWQCPIITGFTVMGFKVFLLVHYNKWCFLKRVKGKKLNNLVTASELRVRTADSESREGVTAETLLICWAAHLLIIGFKWWMNRIGLTRRTVLLLIMRTSGQVIEKISSHT